MIVWSGYVIHLRRGSTEAEMTIVEEKPELTGMGEIFEVILSVYGYNLKQGQNYRSVVNRYFNDGFLSLGYRLEIERLQ